jgi:hypothetical protein
MAMFFWCKVCKRHIKTILKDDHYSVKPCKGVNQGRK